MFIGQGLDLCVSDLLTLLEASPLWASSHVMKLECACWYEALHGCNLLFFGLCDVVWWFLWMSNPCSKKPSCPNLSRFWNFGFALDTHQITCTLEAIWASSHLKTLIPLHLFCRRPSSQFWSGFYQLYSWSSHCPHDPCLEAKVRVIWSLNQTKFVW